MKKKKNEYKPHRHKDLPKKILSAAATLLLAYVFAVLGYSVAKPFGEVGETEISEISGLELLKASPEGAEHEREKEDSIKAYMLAEEEFEDIDELSSEIQLVNKHNYDTIVVPLKIEGGMLNYSSAYEGAVMADVGNDIELSDILSVIEQEGFKPAAAINTMEDNLYPKSNNEAGFNLSSGQKLWYDKQSSDGKPWLDPASTETKKYLSSITSEIAKAGFEYILCTDMKYPPFSAEALEDIGGKTASPDRYLDLIDDVDAMSAAASDKGSMFWLEISADELFDGKSEVFRKPIMLNVQKYVLQIDPQLFTGYKTINGKETDFSGLGFEDKIKKVCGAIEGTIYKTSYIPEVLTDSLSDEEKGKIKDIFSEMGYESYIVK